MKNMKKTVWDVVRDFRQAGKHFESSAKAWEARNNKGRYEGFEKHYEKREQEEAEKGEAILAEYGITCDWPGLLPVFQYRGGEYYTLESIMSQIEANTL